MSALDAAREWLRSLWRQIAAYLQPHWNIYGRPYWKYSIAFTMGSLSVYVLIWYRQQQQLQYRQTTANLQLAIRICDPLSFQSLQNDKPRIDQIWRAYFPKCIVQPSIELLSNYMSLRSIRFADSQNCPKYENGRDWLLTQYRSKSAAVNVFAALFTSTAAKPCFVAEPQHIRVNEHVSLYALSYYKFDLQNCSTDNSDTKFIFHIHGGDFIGGSPQDYFAYLFEISRRTRMVCFTLQYRLCPENATTIIEQVKDCVGGYRHLLDSLVVNASDVCLLGEGSGATLGLLLLRQLKLASLPQPRCAVFQSPCTDLSCALPSMTDNREYDCVHGFMDMPSPCAQMALGDSDDKDAQVSPLYADWTGVHCNLYFMAAEHEMWIDDSKLMAAKAEADGVNVACHWDSFCGHCPALWSGLCVEGQQNLARLVDYMAAKMNSNDIDFSRERSVAFDLLSDEMKLDAVGPLMDIHEQLSVCVLTWNVAQKMSDPKSLRKLLAQDSDIIVVGLQEICDLNAKSMFKKNDNFEQRWQEVISAALASRSNAVKYSKLRAARSFGILMFVFVKEELVTRIDDVLDQKIGTGMLGMGTNKGAVGVRFTICETSIVFVCGHLAAHKTNVNDRNANFHKIMNKLTFSSSNRDRLATTPSRDRSPSLSSSPIKSPSHTFMKSGSDLRSLRDVMTVDSHDLVFFLGDLNYRLEFDDMDSALQSIQKQDWKALLDKDQLRMQRKSEKAFAGFNEHNIGFQPTYKFVPGSSDYDAIKKRIPSYCDRILWKTNDKTAGKDAALECVSYLSSMSHNISDHKPVVGLFKLNV